MESSFYPDGVLEETRPWYHAHVMERKQIVPDSVNECSVRPNSTLVMRFELVPVQAGYGSNRVSLGKFEGAEPLQKDSSSQGRRCPVWAPLPTQI